MQVYFDAKPDAKPNAAMQFGDLKRATCTGMT
jgi:hypothetical protein